MNSKQEKIDGFDPSGIGALNGNLFGLPFNEEESEIIVIPVPWEVTVSFAEGTAGAPERILDASPQLDMFDPELENAWKHGIFMLPVDEKWKSRSDALREKAKAYIDDLEQGHIPDPNTCQEINNGSAELNAWVKAVSLEYLRKGKKVCLLGGDHSTPLGLIQALSEQYGSIGILQIDAHCDLRNAYEGFEFSHASIMFNALKSESISSLVQVGIRDYCEEELEVIWEDPRITLFTDKQLKENRFNGASWDHICDEIIDALPQNVHISFDIDGLDPKLCPNTGTPVPGGLEYDEVLYLFKKVVQSGRKIIGFDLVEVGNDDWDANVGARLLYRMSNLMLKSWEE